MPLTTTNVKFLYYRGLSTGWFYDQHRGSVSVQFAFLSHRDRHCKRIARNIILGRMKKKLYTYNVGDVNLFHAWERYFRECIFREYPWGFTRVDILKRRVLKVLDALAEMEE